MEISKNTLVRALIAAAITTTLIFAGAAPAGPPGGNGITYTSSK